MGVEIINISRFFILAILVSFSYALLQGGNFPFYCFYTLLFAFIITLIYMMIQKKYLSAEVVFKDSMLTAGEERELLIIVKCDTILPIPYILIKNSNSVNDKGFNGALVNMTTEENPWVKQKIKFYKRGIYDLGTVSLTVMDLFHIIYFNKTIDCEKRVKVYPKIYQIRGISSGGKDIYKEAIDIRSRNEDIFTIKDVRKYMEGDNLKKVHWKVSAKKGELYVKNSDNISGEEMSIFLNMNKDDNYIDGWLIEESMIDITTSLIKYMMNKSVFVKLFVNASSKSTIEVKDKNDFDKLMEFLVLQDSDGVLNFEEFMQMNLYHVQNRSRVGIITSELKKINLNYIISVKRNGFSVVIIYCANNETDKQLIDMLRQEGIECIYFEELVNIYE